MIRTCTKCDARTTIDGARCCWQCGERLPRPENSGRLRHRQEAPQKIRQCGRSHQECYDCQLQRREPPECDGHDAGPVGCPNFKGR